MKRIGNLKDKFLTYENFDISEKKARKGKIVTFAMKKFDENREGNLLALIESLKAGTYQWSKPERFVMIADAGKIRNITKVPYFPDRIVHHAILRVLEERFHKTFISNTFNSIKGRGIHLANMRIKKALRGDKEGTKYCLKIDIKKFYESIDSNMMKESLRLYVKDKWLLSLIDAEIDNTEGLSIGGLLSQTFSNVFISRLDHWIKEDLKVKYYFRYADDMVFLSSDKTSLHEIMWRVRNRLHYEYGLQLNTHRQIFKVKDRGLDFIGFVFYHSHTMIRKRIKKIFAKKRNNLLSRASYLGMMKWCDSRNLIYKILEQNNYARECRN